MTALHRRPDSVAGSRVLVVAERARAAIKARQQADVDLVLAAVDWAELHPATDPDDAAGWTDDIVHDEGCAMVAGPGTPLVAEFAPAALAAELGWTPMSALALIADGLDLCHRLPRFWQVVQELDVPVSLARYAAEQSRPLPTEAATDVDVRLTELVPRGSRGHLSRARVRRLIDEVRLYHDPERAVDDEQHALAARRVESWPGNTPATTDMFMRLDTADADAFNATVATIARRLGELGDDDVVEIRRARAVGILADPRRALDLLTTDQILKPSSASSAPATLWLHITDRTLLDIDMHAGAVVSDRLGVLTTDLLKMWLADSTVIVRPVLHADGSDRTCRPVNQHDPPGPMADYIRLRDEVCVFPGCQRPSRVCDLDHIEPYIPIALGGPPGQTQPGNLAPLCRHHHRMKTHGGWSYRRLPEGSYRWTTPHGAIHARCP